MPLKRMLTVLALAWPATTVAAEPPQMLGVVAAAEPHALHCDGPVCSVTLSSFCLQKERPSPAPGTAYRAYDPAAFQAIVRDVSGVRHTVSASGLNFHVARGHTAITVTLGVQGDSERRLLPVAITVGKGALLVPDTAVGDAEARRVARDMLPVADAVFSARASDAATADRLARLIDSADGTSLDWEKARKTVGQTDPRAGGIVGYCRNVGVKSADGDVRACVARRLDDILMDINDTYWKAATPGS